MARYVLTADSVVDGVYTRKGTIVTLADDQAPTAHMERLADLDADVSIDPTPEPVVDPEPESDPEPEPAPEPAPVAEDPQE